MANKKRKQVKKVGLIRSKDDLDLKKHLVESAELFITEKGSDEYLDKLSLKIKLLGGQEFILSDYVSEIMADYEPKFSKDWYYRLADLYQVPRTLMDPYIKPEFVRQFTIEFVYGRFPSAVLRTLRSKNRKTSNTLERTKLFQHMTKDASGELDLVIEQVFVLMGKCKDPISFKLEYSRIYKVYFQLEFGL